MKKQIRLSNHKMALLRQECIERGLFCQFCGTPYHLSTAHIIRTSQGGDDTIENVMAACLMTGDCKIGCHSRYDKYEIELPTRVLNRMTGEHMEEYLKTRKTHR